jgi:hypothetical protein
MPANFRRFGDLPQEIQLMVFEEYLRDTLKPRIVLLDTSELGTGWRWEVGNRTQLFQTRPFMVAFALAGIPNASATRVAMAFVEHLNSASIYWSKDIDYWGNLDLCLESEIFWLPDDLVQFGITTLGDQVGRGTDQTHISRIMTSLAAFEGVLGRETRLGEDIDRGDASEESFTDMLVITIIEDLFPSARELYVMVDIPRGHISYESVQFLRGSDPALPRLGGDNAAGSRCHLAYETYETINRIILTCNPDRGHTDRALPELWFGFRRSALSD